jgi:hypothetical protein
VPTLVVCVRGTRKKNRTQFRTQVDTRHSGMLRQPAYFDSQAQAAAVLNIDIHELRDAKREGCPAFRSGRVYRAPLLAWFLEKRSRGAGVANTGTPGNLANQSSEYRSDETGELSKAHWDRKKARLDYERALFRFEVEKETYLSVTEISVALGQMLVAFRTALNMLPSNAARWVIGLRDFHQIKDKLQSEVDAVLHALNRRDYLGEESLKVIAQSVPFDPETEALVAKLKIPGEDRAFISDLVTRVAFRAIEEFGRSSLSDLLQRDLCQPFGK